MKAIRLLIVINLVLILITVSFAGKVQKVYEFSQPAIEKTGIYSIITFEGTKLLGQPGRASLPFYPVKLLLPAGEIAAAISISYEKQVTLSGDFLLMPYQEVRPVSQPGNPEWLIDHDFYAKTSIYPSNYQPHLETQFYNGSGIALSAFTPVVYHPSRQVVTYYEKVVVTIHTTPDRRTEANIMRNYASAKKMSFLRELVQNPEDIPVCLPVRELRTSAYDYLIITQDQYVAEFDTLVDFYKPRGIRTKVTSTEFISTDTIGADLQEKIRNYISGQYSLCGIDYVLLGGDFEIVPYRGFYCYVDSDPDQESYNIPADLYYSALDGNWNADGDNRWGEPDEDDLYPEVGIGRLTFSNTAELDKMIHKIIMYQDDPVLGELTSPLLAGEYLYSNPPTYGSAYMNLLVGYHTDNGYSTHGIPPEHPRDTLYDKPGFTFTKAQMISQINSGHPWVHHTGHANETYVMRMNNSDITNSNFSEVNGINHNYTIIYTHGCNCGAFDYTDCIAEKMVGIDNLAVTFVGNSRYGWFNQGTSDGPSEHLHREFMDALYYDSLFHIGMAHLKSKSETAPFVDITGEFEPGATRWCFYDNNVLGDPMMACWTREPWLISAEYPELIPIGEDNVIVELTGPNGNCRDFTCSIYRNDTLFGSDQSDASGTAIIVLQDTLTEGPVSLVVSGYNILPQYFTLQVSDYWLGWTDNWNHPANWYTGQVPDSSTCVIIPSDPEGASFPLKNTGMNRNCKAIRIEPGAQLILGNDEILIISGD